MRYYLILVCLGISGCASNLTEADREYNRAMNEENWENCQKLPGMLVADHLHIRGVMHRPHHVKQDLASNNCKIRLGDAWANLIKSDPEG